MTNSSSSVFIRDAATGELVPAEFHDSISAEHLIDWQSLWRPEVSNRLRTLQASQTPLADWPQSWHWDWDTKLAGIQSLLAQKTACITCAGVTQGMMCVNLVSGRGRVDSQKGKELVYIDYLEVAPWNVIDPRFSPPKYKSVGSVLLLAAMQMSIDEGFKGRVGLHSLPQASDFYRRCGFVDMGPDNLYSGNLPYFELTPEMAQAFLNRGSQS